MFLLRLILLMVFVLTAASVSGCASMTGEYWAEKYEQLSEEEKERLGDGLPIAVCDLTDCEFYWIY